MPDSGQGLAHYLSRSLLHIGPVVFAVLVCAALAIGWVNRDEGHLTAETGLGYWLGIAGTTLITLLVLYPLRKRFRILHGLGRVAAWFRLHMLFGVVGPLLIIFHCNFKIGSLNSRLALFTMLTVVTSGIVGRYLYSKVHKGLYGRQVELREIYADMGELEDRIGMDLIANPLVRATLDDFKDRIATPSSTALSSLRNAFVIPYRGRRVRRRVTKEVNRILAAAAARNGWNRRDLRARKQVVSTYMTIYFAAANKAAKLALFERLLALWHIFHMPLFVMLAMTVVIHIVAVHLY